MLHFSFIFFRNFLAGLFLLGMFGCGPKISPLHHSNRFISASHIRIYNDSLKLQLNTPADIDFATSPHAIRKQVKSSGLKPKNPVVLAGSTFPPDYHVVVSSGPRKEDAKPGWRRDTTINGHRLHFIGSAVDPAATRSMTIDLGNMYKRLKSGEGYQETPLPLMDLVNRAMGTNTYLKDFTAISQYPVPANQPNSMEMQMQLTFASFLGGQGPYERLLENLERRFVAKDSVIAVVKKAKVVNRAVFAPLIEAAKNSRLVMINENHYYPNHRQFVIDILPQLKAIGYTHLALEALGSDSLLNLVKGYPTLNDGFYTREQSYGNLLREAKRLGFTFVAYENTDPKRDRELGQAINLYEKSFALNKEAKVLVLAGVDHILEQATSSGKKWMAAVFKDRYAIDPLTISQTHYNSYRKNSTHDYQLFTPGDFAPLSTPPVDFFLLNNTRPSFANWPVQRNYRNTADETVQLSLFYQKELKNGQHFNAVPYFVTVLGKDQQIKLPLNEEAALLVIYNKLGKVLERKELK